MNAIAETSPQAQPFGRVKRGFESGQSPYAQSTAFQKLLRKAADSDEKLPARTLAELARLWLDLESFKRSTRSPRNGAKSPPAVSPAAVPVKPSLVTPASFQEPEGNPGETPPLQGTKP